MFLFIRLLLAHFIGDTVLQPDEVYAIKQNRFAGVVVHAVIIFLSLVAFSWPYLTHSEIWILIGFASITHMVQDEIKMRRVYPKDKNLILFVVDQFLHILFLTPVFMMEFSNQPPRSVGFWIDLYKNDSLMLFAMGFVVTVFLGAYFWESYKIAYFKNAKLFDPYRIKYGMFERALILIAFTFSVWWFLPIPVVFRLLYKRTHFTWSLIFNLITGVAAGLILKGLLPIF
jgi:hypothetical protein